MQAHHLLLFTGTGTGSGTGSGTGCTKTCPSKEQPVCASNKVTYANRCEFENAACSSADITFVSIGPCGK